MSEVSATGCPTRPAADERRAGSRRVSIAQPLAACPPEPAGEGGVLRPAVRADKFMSYDLFFQTQSPWSPVDFNRYFAGRRDFSIRDGQAWYRNEDTGVYFSFELAEDNEAPRYWAQFNINYARPRFFILEALPHVESFVSTFGLAVHDPQIDGMGYGPFKSDGFLRGWTAGNRVACSALAGSGHPRPPTMADDVLKAAWQWNAGRRGLQAKVGESVFVPQIMFVAGPVGPLTAAVWSDAIRVLLPTVDVVFLYRDAYAPRRLFRRKPDVAVLKWDALEPALQDYRVESGPVSYRRLDYASPPTLISTLFRQAVASVPDDVVAADSILESELVARIPEWQASG